MNKTYSYGLLHQNNGNVLSIVNNKDSSRTQSFTYDLLNRITAGWSSANTGAYSWGETYSIDAWGNLQVSPMGGKAHGGNFQLAGNAQNRPTGMSYDAAGNLMSYGSATYIYDQENRLASTAGMTYAYDGNGERVLKSNTSTGTAVKRYWSMGGNTLAEGDGSGNLTAEYIYFDGKRIARVDLPAGSVHYYLSDHLKSTSMVVSSSGVSEEESDYSPFGTEYVITGAGINRYKFTGKERDNETQLDYFGARYYSNGLGRFITPDWAAKPAAVPYAVLGDPQSLNLYTYVRNIPTTNADHDGHFADYYDEKGKKIRSDGVNDGKSFVVGKNGSTTELPDKNVRSAIGDAVNRSNHPTADDKKGGFHEEGVVAGHDKNGNIIANAADPGPYANPKVDPHATVDLGTAVNKGGLVDVTVEAHVHPGGQIVETSGPQQGGGTTTIGGTITSNTYGFNQFPSPNADVATAPSGVNNIVVGARDKTVYFFNQSGVQATFPLKEFLKLP